jgi:hypothetical protein
MFVANATQQMQAETAEKRIILDSPQGQPHEAFLPLQPAACFEFSSSGLQRSRIWRAGSGTLATGFIGLTGQSTQLENAALVVETVNSVAKRFTLRSLVGL